MTAAVVLWGAAEAVREGSVAAGIGIGGLGIFLVGTVFLLISAAWPRGASAEITDQSVRLCQVADPRLREWSWSDIARVGSVLKGPPVTAVVYVLTLKPW